MYFQHELWPKNDYTAKLRYIQKVTKSFVYDEVSKACNKKLEKLAISTTIFYGENHHLHYFIHENSNSCAFCGAAAYIV